MQTMVFRDVMMMMEMRTGHKMKDGKRSFDKNGLRHWHWNVTNFLHKYRHWNLFLNHYLLHYFAIVIPIARVARRPRIVRPISQFINLSLMSARRQLFANNRSRRNYLDGHQKQHKNFKLQK
jgi:hypothetical protein